MTGLDWTYAVRLSRHDLHGNSLSQLGWGVGVRVLVILWCKLWINELTFHIVLVIPAGQRHCEMFVCLCTMPACQPACLLLKQQNTSEDVFFEHLGVWYLVLTWNIT